MHSGVVTTGCVHPAPRPLHKCVQQVKPNSPLCPNPACVALKMVALCRTVLKIPGLCESRLEASYGNLGSRLRRTSAAPSPSSSLALAPGVRSSQDIRLQGDHFPAGAKSEWAVAPSPHSLGEMLQGPPLQSREGKLRPRLWAATPWVSPSRSALVPCSSLLAGHALCKSERVWRAAPLPEFEFSAGLICFPALSCPQ